MAGKSNLTISNGLRCLILALVGEFIGGCAANPVAVSLSAMQREPGAVEKPLLRQVTIVNESIPFKPVRGVMGSEGKYPLRMVPAFPDVLTGDLQEYFANSVRVDAAKSHTALRVRILSADAYVRVNGGASIPILGVAAALGNQNFGLAVRLSIDVEVEGKVQRTYTVEREYIVIAPDRSLKERAGTYTKMIVDYREKLYSELDAQFLSRFLERWRRRFSAVESVKRSWNGICQSKCPLFD